MLKELTTGGPATYPPRERETLASDYDFPRRALAEGLGTALLLMIVVGSGIMGERLANGALGLALLANMAATGTGLMVLILIFAPISGAHFNPAVTLVFALRREIAAVTAMGYIAVQVIGGIAGVWAAHLMFDEPIIQVSLKLRDGVGQIASETIAAFGLVVTILATVRFRPHVTPFAVGLYIMAAYWFTASTSFANPAVTIARSVSNTFAGIAPSSVPGFIAAQLAGALLALVLFQWLQSPKDQK